MWDSHWLWAPTIEKQVTIFTTHCQRRNILSPKQKTQKTASTINPKSARTNTESDSSSFEMVVMNDFQIYILCKLLFRMKFLIKFGVSRSMNFFFNILTFVLIHSRLNYVVLRNISKFIKGFAIFFTGAFQSSMNCEMVQLFLVCPEDLGTFFTFVWFLWQMNSLVLFNTRRLVIVFAMFFIFLSLSLVRITLCLIS